MFSRSMIVGSFCAIAIAAPSYAITLFNESWESVLLLEGETVSLPTVSLPLWIEEPFIQDAVILRPGASSEGLNWQQTEPFAGPADQNQMLALRDGGPSLDNGVFAVLPVQYTSNTTYDLSAAIGADAATFGPGAWSIQLWADSNGNGQLDRSGADAFLGQVFSELPVTSKPSPGQWHRNHITFDSASNVDVVGQNIIVFLNNYALGSTRMETSYFDNVRLDAISNLTLEPTTTRQLEAQSTFLRPDTSADIDNLPMIQDAKRVELSNGFGFHVQEGDLLRVRAIGDFVFSIAEPLPNPGPYGNGTLREVFGAFSSSVDLLDESLVNRIPGAIDVVEGNFVEVVSGTGNDIPEDFWIPSESVAPGGILVRVPVGATHLFLSAADEQWYDNRDLDGNFEVKVTRIYEGRFMGDWDFDGDVDGRDFLLWQRNSGASGVDLPGDGDLDGDVDQIDLAIWQEHFGDTVPGNLKSLEHSVAVPEPSTWLLFLIAAIWRGMATHCRAFL